MNPFEAKCDAGGDKLLMSEISLLEQSFLAGSLDAAGRMSTSSHGSHSTRRRQSPAGLRWTSPPAWLASKISLSILKSIRHENGQA